MSDRTLSHAQTGYRPDIDGLRAIAVVAVVAFHAGVPRFSGGFIGVDIFFVLSGYLITRLILKALDEHTWSLSFFYDRRVRRILPALGTVYLASCVAAAFLLLPADMESFAKSLAYSATFVSNVLFFQEAGYFDGPSHTKPLLHTWSLSIEEQFYLFWPPLLALAYRMGRARGAIVLTATIGFTSLGLAIWIVPSSPSAAFYLLPFRAWELLVGAALPILGSSRLRLPRAFAEALSALGLAALTVPLVWVKGSDPFPGLNAILPCVGTAAVIFAGERQTSLVNRLLSLRPLTLIGLISYSLYLWHWPLLCFGRFFKGRPLDLPETAACIAASLVLASLSFRFIERPFQNPAAFSGSRKRIFQVAFGFLGICVGLGATVFTIGGWESRFAAQALSLDAQAKEELTEDCNDAGLSPEAHCRLGLQSGPSQAVLFGDSHARAIRPGVSDLLARLELSGEVATEPGCPPLWGAKRVDDGRVRKCEKLSRRMKTYLQAHPKPQIVILASRWSLFTNEFRPPRDRHPIKQARLVDNDDMEPSLENSKRVLRESLKETVETLLKGGHRVVLVGQVPAFGSNPVRCLARVMDTFLKDSCALPAQDVKKRLANSNELLREIAEAHPGVVALIPSDIICDADRCAPMHEDLLLYRDNNHVSVTGARYLFRRFWMENETELKAFMP